MIESLKYFNQLALHTIKTYAIILIIACNMPFMAMLAWSEVVT